MPAIRQPVVCGAPNAFRPCNALYQLLVFPLNRPTRQREFSCVSVRSQEDLQHTRTRQSPLLQRIEESDEQARPTRKHGITKGPPRWGKQWMERQNRNVVPTSLEQTLGAHRDSNRASIIRTVETEAGEDVYKRPDIEYLGRHIPGNRQEIKQRGARDGVDLAFEGAQEADPTDWFNHLTRRRNFPEEPKAARDEEDFTEKGRRKKHIRRVKSDEETPVMEYDGQVVLPVSNMTVEETQLPWAIRYPQGIHPLQRLSAEIKAFGAYMKPTIAEQAAREAVVKEVQQVVHDTLPGHTLELFGSQRTGLAVATSDIDLRLRPPAYIRDDSDAEKAPRMAVRKNLVRMLQHKLLPKLQNDPSFILCVFRYARYPLISLQHRGSGLDIQIVLANDTALARERVKRYLTEIPSLGAVYTLVRTMLEVRRLSDVFAGGLGSYSIFMMIVASLKHDARLRPDDAARSLLSFLDFYSKLDTYKVAVSVDPPTFFNKRLSAFRKAKPSQRHVSDFSVAASDVQPFVDDVVLQGQDQMSITDRMQPYLLCLQDPADAFNDLGRKGYAIKHIQRTIKALHEELATYMYRNKSGSVIAPLVGSSYTMFAGRRSKIEGYGRTCARAAA